MTTTLTNRLIIDVHCHFSLTRRHWTAKSPFAYERESPHPCAAYVSPRQMNRILSRLSRWYLARGRRISPDELDARGEQFQLRHLTTFRHVDRVVLLAFDEVHDDDGRSCGPARRSRDFGTDMYVANGLVHEWCRQYPGRFLFGASIHPYRRHDGRDAVALLDEVAAAGAVLIKWLPPVHNIDARDPRTVAFLRRCAELRLPLLVHYGAEFTLSTHRAQAADPRAMFDTLRALRREGQMPTVIVAHVATPVLWPFTPGTHFRQLVDALTGEFADAPLYADTSALAAPSKVYWLRKILSLPALWPKLVHGSDFPIPSVPLAFRRRLGRSYRKVVAEQSWIDRDLLLKRALGLPADVFTRAAGLLRMDGGRSAP